MARCDDQFPTGTTDRWFHHGSCTMKSGLPCVQTIDGGSSSIRFTVYEAGGRPRRRLENLRLRAASRTATASTTKMNHRTGPSRPKNRSVHPGLGLAWLRVRTAIELVIGSMNDGCEKNSNNRQSCHPARQGVSDNEQFSRSRL